MSRFPSHRSATLFLTAGLASLAMAAQPAGATSLMTQTAFDLSATSGATLNLGGASASKSYATSWDQTSKNLGTGVKCAVGVCAGSSLTLRTTGALGATFAATANAGTASLAFKQVTTTTLKATGVGAQYAYSIATANPVAPTFTTSGASAAVSVSGKLSATDSLSAEGCVGGCGSSNQTLLTFGSGNFPIAAMTTAGGGSVSVGGQNITGVTGKSIPVSDGSVSFGAVGGLASTSGTATRTDPALIESLNLLDLATSGGASRLQGSEGFKLGGLNLGTVAYNAGSASLNAIESLVQTATLTISAAIDTTFRNKAGGDISLLVKTVAPSACKNMCPPSTITPNASGFYNIHDISQLPDPRNAQTNGFLVGDGSVNLAGDQIVTATTYTVSFQELLGINLSGSLDLAALQGSAFGKGFGPVFSTDINLGGQTFTVYSHTFTEVFTSYNTTVIPATGVTPAAMSGMGLASLAPASIGGPVASGVSAVPEPAGWTLMLVGVGGVGAALRRRAAAAIA